MVARLAVVFAGTAHSLGAGWTAPHLLLLSRRLLQSILGRSAGLRRRRAAQDLSRRALVPAHHAERASLFSLSRAALHRRAFHRRVERVLVRRSGDGENFIRPWNRHARLAHQRRPSREFHIRLSCAAPRRRRLSRSAFAIYCVLSGLSLCELLQSPPHALGDRKSVV